MPDARSPNGTPLFKNACPDCGVVRLSDRRRLGNPCMSCANKRRATHGLSSHPLYWVLKGIQARCTIPSASNFEYYGGRGIKLCGEWTSDPAAFVQWAVSNGWRPGLEVDRIDADGDYCPDNCRLIEHRKNSQTRRNARIDTAGAERVRALLAGGATVKKAAAELGIPYMVAWHIAKGNTWRAQDEQPSCNDI